MSTLRLAVLLQQLGQHLEPALVGHDDVEQDHVGLQRPHLEDGVARVPRLADRLEVVLGVDEQLEARPDDGVVVDDQDPNTHGSGTSTTSVVPAPDCDSIAEPPPSSADALAHALEPEPVLASTLGESKPRPSSSITAVTTVRRPRQRRC